MTHVRHNVPGSELTTLRTGGPCETVVDVATADELLTALVDHPEAVTIGGGSNLLIRDEGVITPIIRTYEPASGDIRVDAESGVVDVGAAVDWDVLVRKTVESNLVGLECTSGVPGSVGGALVQNLGAYGQEVASVVTDVTTYDRQLRQIAHLTPSACGFAYRRTAFKHDADRRHVVVRVKLQLTPSPTSTPRYGDLHATLSERVGNRDAFALADVRQAVLDVRRTKGMLLGASKPSAGSFFTNPELPVDQFASVENNPGVRVLIRDEQVVRVSAAALMEAASFRKGDHFGRVGLSDLHVLALVNLGGATASEILDVAGMIVDKVQEVTGIRLTPEPVLL